MDRTIHQAPPFSQALIAVFILIKFGRSSTPNICSSKAKAFSHYVPFPYALMMVFKLTKSASRTFAYTLLVN